MDLGKGPWDGDQWHGDTGDSIQKLVLRCENIPHLTSTQVSLWPRGQAKWGKPLLPRPHSASRHTCATEEGSQVDVPMFLGLTNFNVPCVAITSRYIKKCACV